jgi:lipopolysaccharide transport system ATP-binding protein
VSHDLNAVKFLCHRVLLLDAGQTICLGTPDDAVSRYNQVIAPADSAPAAAIRRPVFAGQTVGYGSLEVQIVAARVTGHRSGGSVIASGEIADVTIAVKCIQKVDDVTVGFAIKNRFGQEIYGTNTFHHAKRIELGTGDSRTIVFQMALNLAPGAYTLTAAVHGGDTHLDLCYHWCDNAATFEIAGTIGPGFTGVCRLEPSILVD